MKRFSTDTEAELNLVRDLCLKEGAFAAVIANHWAKGGAGATDLGEAVISACAASRAEGCPFQFLYPLEKSLKEKIETVCKEMYGADGVEYSDLAEERIQVQLIDNFPYRNTLLSDLIS